MAKTLSIFYLPIHKRIEGTVMGWQIPVLYKIANDPKVILNNTRTGSVQDGLRN
jgi:hypothetical protein